MTSLSSLQLASTLIGQSLSNLASLNQGQNHVSELAIHETDRQARDADDPFLVDLTQSLMDKQIQVSLTMIELEADQSAARDRGSDLEAGFITLAKIAYSEVAAALTDKVEARNERDAALAVEGLEVKSLENVKELIDASDSTNGTEGEPETTDDGERLDKQAREAQETADALKDIKT